MKQFKKIYAAAIIAVAMLAVACDKKDALPTYENGVATSLSASAATVAPLPADSNKVALTLNWTSPKYATDSSTVKYVIEIDSTGRNFAKAVKRTVVGKLSDAFIAKDLNAILLGFGFNFNVAYDVDVRVTSSYSNNNQQLKSNTIKIKMTPYKIPPKVAIPASGKLFIVGDASQGGWNNPVPAPVQELTRIDETTFGGIFKLNGGKEYLILPVNGSWDTKYVVADKGVPSAKAGGDFSFSASSGDNFPAPVATGLYKIIMDFQTGKYAVTEFTQQHGLPDSLFVTGEAVPSNWTNPAPLSQKFTRINSTKFELVVNMTKNKEYLILPENGSWLKKYGVEDKTLPAARLGGKIVPEGQNFPSPTEDGSYKIVLDVINNNYTLTKQ
jgi:starch-binding outer membrane protein SusE/F